MQPRFVIADPSLRDGRGHHFSLSQRVSQSAREAGFDPAWMCHMEARFGADVPVRIAPVFSVSLYDAYKKRDAARPAWTARFEGLRRRWDGVVGAAFPGPVPHRVLAGNIRQGIGDLGLGSTDRILFHTADGQTYAALKVLFDEVDPDHLPLMHVCTPYDPEGIMPNKVRAAPIATAVASWSRRGLIGRRVFLYGENERLAEHLARVWAVPVRSLPLPAVSVPEPRAQDVFKRWNIQALDDALKIVHLGPARLEKGFHLLPDILDAAFALGGPSAQLRFIIQCTPQIVGYNPTVLRAIERLKGFAPDTVSLIQDTLSDADYTEIIAGSDVVLMPYGQKEYEFRSSGVVTEALSMGKIIVATAGTYPASMVAPSAGAVASDAREFGEALVHIWRDRAAFRAAAAREGARYRELTASPRYVQSCLESER